MKSIIAKTSVYSVILSLAALASPDANAQQLAQPVQGFAINRFNPAERGSQWFALDSLDLRGHLRPAIGTTLDLAYKPLVIYQPDGSEGTTVINTQVFAHLGASFVLWDRLRLGVNLPLAVQQSGQSGTFGTYNVAPPTSAALGDLRLGGDVRLYGTYGDPFTVALGIQMFAPTGNRAQYTSDDTFRFLPRLSASGQYGRFTYAAMLGVQYRSLDEGFANNKTGTEFAGGMSIGVKPLGDDLVIGPELYGSTIIASADDVKLKQPKAPVEVILGAHYTAGQFRIGAGLGPGVTRGLGSPAVRAMASIEWVPGVASKAPASAPPRDRDGDGIYDGIDACPDIPGVRNDNPRLSGCPQDDAKGVLASIDRDKDQVFDELDKCPDVPGLREPPVSLTAAQKELWEKKFIGCPEDIDNDKILNIPDACPMDPGQPHKDPLRHGCPLAIVDECQIKIKDLIYFKTQSDKLETVGEKGRITQSILQAVFEILQTRPQITQLEIQGHASQDNYAKNQELSDLRAAAVLRWLVERGTDAKRLTPRGYGMTRPATGVPIGKGYKELHQRVEFHIHGPKCDSK